MYNGHFNFSHWYSEGDVHYTPIQTLCYHQSVRSLFGTCIALLLRICQIYSNQTLVWYVTSSDYGIYDYATSVHIMEFY